ncbi:tetratricopeptide repeat protein [Nannocystis sp. SCPEA4]|uniref:tetratricopeptide repeat protein n=1 Tax=Nannocystis sp. SCPEA4 TaxID=2996787 RepID=UPI00226E244A|nr:tetratricopeptide repeat protein [Nannocystis sp. SCPEA4]MCY1059322.1 tetratricopeptide repeat protein [Nannocystis sp. SCPEA4]
MTGDVSPVDAALATPGPKLVAWDASRSGEAAFAVFAVSPVGARLLAQGEAAEREATAAAWRRRGLRIGAWYGGHEFVWVADELGCIVWSRATVRLDLTLARLRFASDTLALRDVRAVVSFVADDWVRRGVLLERSGGDPVVALDEHDEAARLDPTYNYDNFLMSDAGWVSCFGRDLAAWLGVPHRDDAFGGTVTAPALVRPEPRDDIDRLAHKLAELRALGPRFGYETHRPLTLATVDAFEHEYGVALPSDYVQFLVRIGDGGTGPISYHPVYRLSHALGEGRPARPFLPTGPVAHASAHPSDIDWLLRQADDEASREIAHRIEDEFPADWSERDGCVMLGTDGCGSDSLLVVAGERRGEVWLACDFGMVRIGRSFVAWYERWLDERIAQVRDRLESPGHLADLADAGVRAGRFGEALAAAEELRRRQLALDPDSDYYPSEMQLGMARAGVDGHLDRVAVLLDRCVVDDGWTGQAVEALHDLLARRDELLERALVRGGTWTRADVEAALRAIDAELLADERAAAFAACDEVLALIPDCSTVRMKLAVAMFAYDDPAGALAHLERHSEPCAHAWSLRACAWSRLGRLDEALACAEMGLSLRPGWSVLRDNLGAFYNENGDPARAAEIHAASIAAEPEYEWAHHNRGVALARLGRPEEALACIRRALELGYPRWRVAAEPGICALQRSPAYRAMMNEG